MALLQFYSVIKFLLITLTCRSSRGRAACRESCSGASRDGLESGCCQKCTGDGNHGERASMQRGTLKKKGNKRCRYSLSAPTANAAERPPSNGFSMRLPPPHAPSALSCERLPPAIISSASCKVAAEQSGERSGKT